MDIIAQKEEITIRLARKGDFENYFENFSPLDKEVARLTGSKEVFTREEVKSFFLNTIEDNNIYLFLIVSRDGKIIGETVINDIDRRNSAANFRICIFQKNNRGKGIGVMATKVTRDFAFEKLKLHRLYLEVYSFNPIAKETYLKAGFKQEGCLRDSVLDGEKYADTIVMSILEDEWKI
jgi:RimJ/RimL family protein N-acetyltransferase